MATDFNSSSGLKQVRGLGSAKSGVHHWWLQRVTAAGNLILLAWFIASLILLPSLDRSSVLAWVSSPLVAVPMLLLILTTFWHARLGVQVLIEDYVHEHANKFACMALLNLSAFAGAAFGLFSIVRLALGAA